MAVLLTAARTTQPALASADAFGQRYVLDVEVAGSTGLVTVRSIWIVRVKEDVPRPVTCYIRCAESVAIMMEIQLLDVVALTEDRPEQGPKRGQVGTVVELLGPGVFEVEFSDDEGRTYATSSLRANQLLVLHYEPIQVA